jgi:type VI secretion system protein ImpA
MEGFKVLAPFIELLLALQQTFWPTLHPMIEEGGDLELRSLAVEAAARQIVIAVRKVPLTKSGLSYEGYLGSRAVGYEKDATTSAKQEVRSDAINHGKLTAEDFDHEVAISPKSLYAEVDVALRETLAATERLDQFQREAYGDLSPNLIKLQEGLEEVHQIVESLLNEKRKTDPDPVAKAAKPAAEAGGEAASEGQAELAGDGEPSGDSVRSRVAAAGQLGGAADAYALIVECAQFLFDRDSKSPVPYLVCAGLRLGETMMQGTSPAPGFAVGPTPAVRHSMRTLAARGVWHELLRASLPVLAGEGSRAWLDLHRYIWRASQETGAEAISAAVVGTVKSLLRARPELRQWTLEDDTGAANPETQQWLDATVLQ